jgi:hypothetical protein
MAQYGVGELSLAYGILGGQFDQTLSKGPEEGGSVTLNHVRQMTMHRRCLFPEGATFHAQMEYNYHYTRFQTEHAQLLGFLDSLGVNLDPSIIWNAIPWSFLVDWLVGVNRWLASRKVLNMEPVVNITRYLWSWKTFRKTRYYFYSNHLSNRMGPIPPTYLPDCNETVYRRDVMLPENIGSALKLSGLNSREFSLGVALAITRLKRSQTWRNFSPKLRK